MVTGHYDMIAIFEAPDDTTLAKAILSSTSHGNITSETCRAFTEDEYRSGSLQDFVERRGSLTSLSTRGKAGSTEQPSTSADALPIIRSRVGVVPVDYSASLPSSSRRHALLPEPAIPAE
jgi:hypothetical protein